MYDGDAILLEYDGADALQARYAHGEEIDQPLAMARDVDGSGLFEADEQYYYHTDHLGSVRLLTDAAGAVISRYDYDSFGNLEATSFEGVANPYGFAARERDAESGLMFYRARYYDPEFGRFISEDPLRSGSDDLNLYRYVKNKTLTYRDPFGLTGEAVATRGISLKNATYLSLITALTICPLLTIADTFAEAMGSSLREGGCSYDSLVAAVADGSVLTMAQRGSNRQENQWSIAARSYDPYHCEWLEMELDLAKRAGNMQEVRAIQKAQKWLGCRHKGNR